MAVAQLPPLSPDVAEVYARITAPTGEREPGLPRPRSAETIRAVLPPNDALDPPVPQAARGPPDSADVPYLTVDGETAEGSTAEGQGEATGGFETGGHTAEGV